MLLKRSEEEIHATSVDKGDKICISIRCVVIFSEVILPPKDNYHLDEQTNVNSYFRS